MEEKITVSSLFDVSKTIASGIFADKTYPWEILPEISDFIYRLGESLPADIFSNPKSGVWIAKSASIAPTAYINPPCIIDEDAEIRHCAFIRGSAIIGKKCVIGNSCELKNCIIFDMAQIPHFNYVGDSVIGFRSHLGAGAITSNVKSDKTPVKIKSGGPALETGRKKVGAFLGDGAEVGCNSVLNPGTVVGRNTRVYPLSSVRGVIPENSVYKNRNEIILQNKSECGKEA